MIPEVIKLFLEEMMIYVCFQLNDLIKGANLKGSLNKLPFHSDIKLFIFLGNFSKYIVKLSGPE
jgi:hypothetical protein